MPALAGIWPERMAPGGIVLNFNGTRFRPGCPEERDRRFDMRSKKMADKQACDAYAVEMARRFEEFVHWSRENWPIPASPLLDSDFAGCRMELKGILGQRLDEAQSGHEPDPSSGGAQYVSANPAPWP
jgi:hypothetical protein